MGNLPRPLQNIRRAQSAERKSEVGNDSPVRLLRASLSCNSDGVEAFRVMASLEAISSEYVGASLGLTMDRVWPRRCGDGNDGM
jgi:hypothetical protein